MLRTRRLRKTPSLRRLFADVHVGTQDMVMPLFAVEGNDIHEHVGGVEWLTRLSPDVIARKVEQLLEVGISAVLLFGVPGEKPNNGEVSPLAFDEKGPAQSAIRTLKASFGDDLTVIADVCLCAYTSHGHCGLLRGDTVDNDATLELLGKVAVSTAAAGADVVAPSAMMDGQVRAVREALDAAGFKDTAILSYSAKHASSLYRPFREAARSAPSRGDRKSYQMAYTTRREALREALTDVEEGADAVMVKPALFYLDVISRLKARIDVPLAAYMVSGECMMVHQYAAQTGPEDAVDLEPLAESLVAVKRAGADVIITYFAEIAAKAFPGGIPS